MFNCGKYILSILALAAATLAAVNGLSRCEECLSLRGMACEEFVAHDCACQSHHAGCNAECTGHPANDTCIHDDCSHVYPAAPTFHAPAKYKLSAHALHAAGNGFSKPVCSIACHSHLFIDPGRTPSGSSPPAVLRC